MRLTHRDPLTPKEQGYLAAFEAWIRSRKRGARELRAAALDELADNQVPLTPAERQEARKDDKRGGSRGPYN